MADNGADERERLVGQAAVEGGGAAEGDGGRGAADEDDAYPKPASAYAEALPKGAGEDGGGGGGGGGKGDGLGPQSPPYDPAHAVAWGSSQPRPPPQQYAAPGQQQYQHAHPQAHPAGYGGQGYGGQGYGGQGYGGQGYGAPASHVRPQQPGAFGAGERGNTVVLNFVVQHGSCTEPTFMKMPEYGWRADMGPFISEAAFMDVCDEVNEVMRACAAVHLRWSRFIFLAICIGILLAVATVPLITFSALNPDGMGGGVTGIVLGTTVPIVVLLVCIVGVPLTYRMCCYSKLMNTAMGEVAAIVQKLNTRWEVEQKDMWWRFYREYPVQDASSYVHGPQAAPTQLQVPTIVIHLHERR